MRGPYREQQTEGRRLEPDPAARRKVRLAGLTTAALGVGIGATAPMLGSLAAAFGGGLALLGLVLYREAPKSPMKAACPTCGATIAELDPTTDAVRCPTCGDYARVMSGLLAAVPHDFVAREPLFAIPLELALFGLPAICAECGAPDARHLVRVVVSVHGTPLAVDTPAEVVEIPHCREHDSGAAADIGTVRVRSRELAIEAEARAVPARLSDDERRG
ncbi:MAG: hypothetical protein KF850_21610 [Labilithrix sp.]|nr:hypothetical protein [Labilithrix sp.]